LVVLNGALTVGATNGLDFETGSSSSEVQGLVIQQFGANGILFHGTSGNLVVGNYIGTDANGTAKLGNSGDGVLLDNGASSNTVGGTTAGTANVISANKFGVVLSDAGTSGNLVVGNFIGTDKNGTANLGNTSDGVLLDSGVSANTVGGTTLAASNVISANGLNGVELSGTGTSGNLVEGNLIGTGTTGHLNLNLGNVNDGVRLDSGASANTVGGTADAGNLITFNAKGVVVGASPTDITTVHDPILSNSIFANKGIGIDLGNNGPTPNGANPRPFPNDGQNALIVLSVSTTLVAGRLTSVPNTDYSLQFFRTPAGGPPLQGQFLISALVVHIGSSGTVLFSQPLPPTHPGDLTVTATNLSTGDTSEFSHPQPTITKVTSNPTISFRLVAQSVQLSAVVSSVAAPVNTGTVTFTIVGLPGQVTGPVNSSGQAIALFPIPAGTKVGKYTIVAQYNATVGFADSVGFGTLTVIFSGLHWGP
jgi:hypothetical protein